MLKPRKQYPVFCAAIAAALFMTAGLAQAQTTAAQANADGKRCEAGNSDSGGKAGEFNPDSSSSACRLAISTWSWASRSS